MGRVPGLNKRAPRIDLDRAAVLIDSAGVQQAVTVVDVSTMSPIRSVEARESDMTLPLNATGARRAWGALTPEGKVDALERVLGRGVTSATLAALAG